MHKLCWKRQSINESADKIWRCFHLRRHILIYHQRHSNHPWDIFHPSIANWKVERKLNQLKVSHSTLSGKNYMSLHTISIQSFIFLPRNQWNGENFHLFTGFTVDYGQGRKFIHSIRNTGWMSHRFVCYFVNSVQLQIHTLITRYYVSGRSK